MSQEDYDYTFYAIHKALSEIIDAKEDLQQNRPTTAFETLLNAEHILRGALKGHDDSVKNYLHRRA